MPRWSPTQTIYNPRAEQDGPAAESVCMEIHGLLKELLIKGRRDLTAAESWPKLCSNLLGLGSQHLDVMVTGRSKPRPTGEIVDEGRGCV